MNAKAQNYIIITYGNFPYGRASANLIRNLAVGLSEYQHVEVLLPTGYSFGNIGNKYKSKVGNFNGVHWRYLFLVESAKSSFGKVCEHVFGNLNLFIKIVSARLAGKKPLIIKYNIGFSSNLLLLISCRLLGLKLINILPEFYERPQKAILATLKWYDFYFGIFYLSRFSDGMIVLSTFLRNYIQKHGYTNPVIIVPNLIDPKTFVLSEKVEKMETITIGYAGTPTVKDGIDDLMSAFSLVVKEFPAANLLVIGDLAKTTVIPKLKGKAKELNIQNNVTFTGLVSFNEVPSLLHSCDILVLARPEGVFAEAGFPTKLGEYMACKKPVVVTSVGDIKYYFNENNCVLLVEPGNIKSIASGIVHLIKNKNLRESLGLQGYQWMLQNLEYKRASKMIVNFLNDV